MEFIISRTERLIFLVTKEKTLGRKKKQRRWNSEHFLNAFSFIDVSDVMSINTNELKKMFKIQSILCFLFLPIYRLVQKKGSVLLSTSLAWPAVAG